MSNLAEINVFEKTNIVSKEVCYSIEIEDNCNIAVCPIAKDQIPKKDIDIFQYLVDIGSDDSEIITDMIIFIRDYEKEVMINGTKYGWEEIKHVFNTE